MTSYLRYSREVVGRNACLLVALEALAMVADELD